MKTVQWMIAGLISMHSAWAHPEGKPEITCTDTGKKIGFTIIVDQENKTADFKLFQLIKFYDGLIQDMTAGDLEKIDKHPVKFKRASAGYFKKVELDFGRSGKVTYVRKSDNQGDVNANIAFKYSTRGQKLLECSQRTPRPLR